tara:strand:+ start:333 stop:563 length:231 start_codon:yes stop_codon:yes gene_type:complete
MESSRIKCSKCHQYGLIKVVKSTVCSNCDGEGYIKCPYPNCKQCKDLFDKCRKCVNGIKTFFEYVECYECGGKGDI